MRNFVKTISALNICVSIPTFFALVLIILFTLCGVGFSASEARYFGYSNYHISPDFILIFVIEGLIALWLIFLFVMSFKQAININANYWGSIFSLVFLNFILCSFITLWFIGVAFTGWHLSIFNPIVLGVGFISLLPLALLSND